MGKKNATSFKPGQCGNPNGRPKIPFDVKQARASNKIEFDRAVDKYLNASPEDLDYACSTRDIKNTERLVAIMLQKAIKDADTRRAEFILDRVFGRAAQEVLDQGQSGQEQPNKIFTFEEFCENAGYPKPFPKQIEMKDFAFNETVTRMLLGARGTGKTDYVTLLGTAYDVYLNPESTNLIISKSKTRNTAMIHEIANALTRNGVRLEMANSSCIRIHGQHGKDHSVEAITVKTSMRGRHPFRVLMDDPVTEEDVSEATRLLVKRKYDEVMKLCQNVIVIGQPAHKYDLYAELRGILKKMEVPHGTIPELDHDLEAQRLAGVDEASIQASYFLNVLSEGTTPFDNIKYMDIYPMADSVAFIDPSFEGVDYTAITILRQYMQGVAVVGFTFKKAWNHCIDELVEKMKKYRVRRVCFETNSLGDQPIVMLRQALKDTGVGVVGKKSNGNKHSRIMAAGSFAHLIHLSKESDRQYQDQVVKYEYKAKHDDAPDSLASALEWLCLIRGKE